MKIYLIRHGETTGDIEDRYGGDYDDHLTDKGKQQTQELAQKLKDKGIEKIFASPLIRAQETSQILKDVLEVEIETVEDLRERNQYGVLTGLVIDEARKKYPELVEALKDFHNTIDGAESYEHFAERIKTTLDKLASSKDNSVIAVVTHGGPIKSILRMILNSAEINDIKDCGFFLIETQGDNLEILNTDNLYK